MPPWCCTIFTTDTEYWYHTETANQLIEFANMMMYDVELLHHNSPLSPSFDPKCTAML